MNVPTLGRAVRGMLAGALGGAVAAWTLLPALAAAGLVWNVPLLMNVPPRMSRADMVDEGWAYICNGALVLGLLMGLLPKSRMRLACLVYLAFPWAFMALGAALLTPAPRGLWYRGLLNGTAHLLIALVQCLLAAAAFLALEKALVRRGERENPAMGSGQQGPV